MATVEENIHTVRDRVLFGIASGAYKFRWKDKGVSVGLAREMGLSGSEAERKSRIGILRNDGYTPSSLAHHIWEETGRELNDNDIRSEVIDVLYSVTSKRQALEELETSLGLNEDAYYQEQAEAHQFEEEQRAEVEARYNEIQNQLNEENFVSLRDKALSLGATLKQLQDVQIDTDYIDLIEQLEDGRRQTSDSTGNNEQIEVDNGEENNDQRTQRAVGDGNRSEENTGYSRQDSYSTGDRISLSPEEQRVVNEATEQIDAEIAEIESSIRAKQTELQNKRKELGKEYAKENQTDLFPTEKTSDNLFDVDADFSKKNIESIIKPIENELSSLLNKGRYLMNSKSKRVNDALDNHRKQGNLLDEIARAESETDTTPSEAQKEAGNYKKGKVNIQGLDISIEQAKGSTRSGVNADGKAWSVMMNNTYGYIRGTEGKDGDHIDVFIGDNPESTRIYVVDQVNKEGRFDEHKVMLGFESEASAKEAYLSNYESGWQGLGNITEVGIEDFSNWAKSDTRRIKPFAEYKSVQASMEETRLQDGDAWNIGDINDTFNEQLKEQISGALPKGYVYNLGHPSDVLQSAGIPDLPIELASARLYHKSNQENHPFELSEITDLPIAVQNPLAVFRSATHLGSNVILTELEHKGKNFVVAIDTNRKQGRIEVNSIRSVHYRSSNAHMANWIEEGLLDYADKKRMTEWLSKQRYNSADVRKLFSHATKIVNEFENPKLQRLNNRFRSIDASKAGKLIDVLKKTGLAKDVVTDTALYDAKLRELGYDVRDDHVIDIKDTTRFMRNKGGSVYGFVTSDNVVYWDSRRMNANTPIHEFGHLWNSFTKENNTVLWTKGEELIMQSPYYWEKVNQNPAYSHLSKGAKIDEALAMAIGDKGEAFVNRTMKERFVDWMAEMWKFIKQKLGVSDQLDIANMTLNNFTDKAVKDLLRGKELEKNSNFEEKGNRNERTEETRLDNRGTMESSTFRETLVEPESRDRISQTITDSVYGGKESTVYEAEELEELEARGIDPYFDKAKFRANLKQQAQQNGTWLDAEYLADKELIHDQRIQQTSENDVYLSADKNSVTKLNNFYGVQGNEIHNNLNALIDRLKAHNKLFPNNKYTIKGFTDNKHGFVSMVLEQPFVNAERNATQSEIDEYLTEIGFKKSGSRSWSNGHEVWSNGVYELFDARPANVLMGKDGHLYFIDTIPHSVEYMDSKDVYDENVRLQIEENADVVLS